MQAMKEGLNAQAIDRIAGSLVQVMPGFPVSLFSKEALSGLASLELKERVTHLIDALHICLPDKFTDAATILRKLPSCWIPGDPDDPLRGFAAWPVIDYVSVHGLDTPEEALMTLETLTPLFSAEFAIRPFISSHFDLTYNKLLDWCEHPDKHVRRLASEGSRPRLPWGMRLQNFIKDPEPVFPILEKLKNDPELYVRRSVANNLNDISKDHNEKVISICSTWMKNNPTGNTKWVVRHASRSLIKKGHNGAFSLLGYTENPDVTVSFLTLEPLVVSVGAELKFELGLKSNADDQSFVVDYAIHYMKANGKTSPKVFKLKSCELNKGEQIQLTKKHSFRLVTTRKYYPGEHKITIHINGVMAAEQLFQLRA